MISSVDVTYIVAQLHPSTPGAPAFPAG